MNHFRRYWPAYFAALTLFTTVFLSQRSWKTYDVFVLNRGKDAFPSITIFTVDSSIRIDISKAISEFSFDGQFVPQENGWHTIHLDEIDDEVPFWGAFHFIPPWDDGTFDWELFIGVPIWLALIPGYFPLMLFLHKHRRERLE